MHSMGRVLEALRTRYPDVALSPTFLKNRMVYILRLNQKVPVRPAGLVKFECVHESPRRQVVVTPECSD